MFFLLPVSHIAPESSQSFGASVIVSLAIISFIAAANTKTLSCEVKKIVFFFQLQRGFY